MSKLTGTFSEQAEYEFTTLTTVPGTLSVHGAPSECGIEPTCLKLANYGLESKSSIFVSNSITESKSVS